MNNYTIIVIVLVVVVLFYFTTRTTKECYHESVRNVTTISPDDRTVRIIVPKYGKDSSGTPVDAEILSKLILNSYIIHVDKECFFDHPESQKHAYINLFIEQSSNGYPATYNWLMVNQDCTLESSLANKDLYICKTKYAVKVLRKNGIPQSKIVYTRFTSPDSMMKCSRTALRNYPKDDNLFLHLAGKSHLKQTATLIRAWIKAKGFHKHATLIITSRGKCRERIQKLLDKHFFHSATENVYVHQKYKIIVYEFIDNRTLCKLMLTAGCYVCPSLSEGYGHYINEGRSAGACIITTDAPPMNELVTTENGYLIPYEYSEQPKGCLRHAKDFIVRESALISIVNDYLNDPNKNEKRIMSRKMYDDDTLFFETQMRSIVANI